MACAEKESFDSNDDEPNEPQKPKPFDPEEEGMVVKPTCECSQCVHWTKSADWCLSPQLQFESCEKKCIKEKKKLQPLLRSDEHPGKKSKIKTFNTDHLTKIEKQKVFRTLVHGEVIPKPVQMCTETLFSKDLQKSLEALKYRFSLPIQSFAWPAIFARMNVFMVGGPASGKTLAYLPAVCTFTTIVDPRYEELAKHKGPIVVILCSNSKQCEKVWDLFKKLYNVQNIKLRPKVTIMTYPLRNVQGTDILITIPDSLIQCLKERILNLKRMCHLVLEDTSTLLKNNEDSIYKILNVANEMLEHRSNNTKVTVIATSEKWTTDLEKFAKSLYITPLICIGNYLEAALYGNIQFEVKFIMSHGKLEYLEGLLRNKYHLYKTIIICDQTEIVTVNKWLVARGVKTIMLSDNSRPDEIEECETLWAYAPGGQFRVFLCTDFIFDSLVCINDAMWLINYSFPSTWTRFTKRFSALSLHYKSPLDSSEDGIRSKSFLMIDESCDEQMGKILNLMSRLTKDLPSNYQKYSDGFRERTETQRIDAEVELCETLKLFGKCTHSLCKGRHLLSEELDISDSLPKSGRVVFKILNIKDVTQYTVQLIEHTDLNGQVRKINDDDLKKPLVYNSDMKKKAEDIKVGKFYAHCDYTTEGEVYTLCHVINIEKETVNVMLSTGLALQTLKNKLYEIPPNLSIIDIYLCNLLPPLNDTSFSGRSFFVTRTSLEQKHYKSILLTGTIHLQLDKTLWLDNVVEMFTVDGTDVIKFNLTKHLISLKVVQPCKSQITNLHKLCAKCKIVLPTYVKQVAKAPAKKKEELEPQVAFLDDNVNEVILSSAITPEEFYVRLAKFQSLLENLEKDIQTAVETEILDKNLNIEIGKYYLAMDTNDENYARAKILNVEGDKALCFYVDYGDEGVVDLKTLKILPSKFITKLPFQAIQCRLYGLCPAFGTWETEATDVLYKFMFEPDSDIFRSLFVEARAKDEGDLVRAKTKYSVLMKDGYGDKNVLINQLLLDCGFATSIFDKLDDVTIPEPQVMEDTDTFLDSDVDESRKIFEEESEEEDSLEEKFDFEIFDKEAFMEMVGFSELREKLTEGMKQMRALQERAIKDKKSEKSNIVSNDICERPSGKATHLTPEVFWSQTDKTVRIKIKLTEVEQYKTNVVQKRIFTFSTNKAGKNYEIKFTLHKPAELSKHVAYGQEVQVVLNKVEPLEWSQLTGTKKRLRYIHYEMDDKEEEVPRRKFLQLDITDDESDDDDDMPMYHVTSDLDSDFDVDAELSSDDD